MKDRDTALEEIRVVREMIEATRQRLRGAWVPFLIFGVLGILACLTSQLLLAVDASSWIGLPWLAFLLLGVVALRGWSRRWSSSGRTPFVGRMLANLWRGVAMALLALWIAAAASGALNAGQLGTMIVLGLGVFASGRLIDYAPLSWSAGLWWLGALVTAVRPDLLFVAQAVVIGLSYLLPAWGLYREEVGEEAHAA